VTTGWCFTVVEADERRIVSVKADALTASPAARLRSAPLQPPPVLFPPPPHDSDSAAAPRDPPPPKVRAAPCAVTRVTSHGARGRDQGLGWRGLDSRGVEGVGG
jgi:hypothetical protein